ncbi:MAG: tetratricopeptide repeat protein [Methylacidiphilales bacterium]|nr:tetratricopeptide repeat protein [Candidatus Methylacidiphilales bacterium]
MANPNWKLLLLRALLIVAAGLWVFAPALHGDWLMDDDLYITQNVLVNDPARLWKIWFAPGSLIEYYPIEASVQAIQWRLWRLDTLGYHVTNILLHVLGALLVWRLLSKFGLRLAWLGGFLFAVHPAVVESVAWISELKNTLSLPFFLLAMCSWIDYERRRQPRDYLLALGLFLAAMLCKISMALFPLVILLYAWWKRGRIGWSDLKAAAPFFAVSLVLGLTTIWAGDWFREAHLQSTNPQQIGGFAARLALAGLSISFYFFKCVWPAGMLPIYPKWPVNPPSLIQFLPWPILAGAIGWFWHKRATWGRHALLGLGFFLINLAPFIGFNSASYMGFTWVMDHFLYLPLIGLIGVAIAALDSIDGRISILMRRWLAVTIAVVLALLAWESHEYAGVFASPEKLWAYTIAGNPTSWLAHNNLGDVFLETGRLPAAIEQYEESLQFNPNGVEAHNNLGLALYQSGRIPEAIENYELALKRNPHFGVALTNLANALAQTGQVQQAIDTYQQALLVNPQDANARASLAKLQARQKK